MGIQQTDLDACSHAFNSQPSGLSSSYSNPPQDNETLADEITLLAGQINAANYRFLKLIAEYDRRWVIPGTVYLISKIVACRRIK